MEKIGKELENLLIKVLIPALVAVSIKIAIDSRKKPISVFSVLASITTGLGMAYLFSGLIESHCSEDMRPLAIGAVAISGDKLASWIINKLSIDIIIRSFFEFLIERFYKK